MFSRTSQETRLSEVLHADIVEMDVLSVGGAKYLVTLIKEGSEYVSSCHVKTKRETAELLKRHGRCFERQTDLQVRKTVLDGGQKYFKGINE